MTESIPPYSPELIAKLESDIGVPDKFFSNIIHEDDWSFIIKLHGMVDAGLTQLIIAHFGDDRLEAPDLEDEYSRTERQVGNCSRTRTTSKT